MCSYMYMYVQLSCVPMGGSLFKRIPTCFCRGLGKFMVREIHLFHQLVHKWLNAVHNHPYMPIHHALALVRY